MSDIDKIIGSLALSIHSLEVARLLAVQEKFAIDEPAFTEAVSMLKQTMEQAIDEAFRRGLDEKASVYKPLSLKKPGA